MKAAFVVAVLFAVEAFAQVGEPVVAPSPLSGLLAQFVSPGGVATMLGVVGSLVGTAVWLTKRRKEIIGLAGYYGFHIVEDIGAMIEGEDKFDKTARYLKEVDGWLRANGWRPLKPGEVEAAKMQATALHGIEVAKAKVAVAAAEAVAAVPAALAAVAPTSERPTKEFPSPA